MSMYLLYEEKKLHVFNIFKEGFIFFKVNVGRAKVNLPIMKRKKEVATLINGC